MATVPSVRVIKSFPFKGGSRVWSNRYHFVGGTPVDTAHWNTLFDAVTAAEKVIHNGATIIIEAVGYGAGSEVPIASKTYSLAGTHSPTGSFIPTPGEAVALVRYSTNARSVKNHPIYCFNYYHGAYVGNTTTTCDTLWAQTRTAMQTYATAWITGFSDGTITAQRSSPKGSIAVGSIVEEYVTHRDFPPSPSL
jgi:hypothetical protein